MNSTSRSLLLHGGLIAALFVLQFILSDFHHGNLSRIMVLACFAMGYNILFGYCGLLSLGHAMLFSAGLYGMGLSVRFLGASAEPALLAGVVAGALVSAAAGFLALRTAGVAFMIVTLMFSQAFYLAILFFGEYTRADEGFVIDSSVRILAGLDVTTSTGRYFAALTLFAICVALSLALVHSRFGKILVAIRENEDRARMLGYDVFLFKFLALLASGTMSAAAGASYGLLFGYAGATFASVQYSIFPLLYVLLGGTGTLLGPFVGALFMFYLIDFASGLTSAYMLLVGLALVLLTLFAPQGILGEVRKRFWSWLP